MSGLEELGDDLHVLGAALRSSPDSNPRALQQAADRLRAERLQESATGREALARQLRLPRSLVEPWLDDTLQLLSGNQSGPARRKEAIERLSAIAWALGEVPPDWPSQQEAQARHSWASWRERR